MVQGKRGRDQLPGDKAVREAAEHPGGRSAGDKESGQKCETQEKTFWGLAGQRTLGQHHPQLPGRAWERVIAVLAVRTFWVSAQ